MEAIADIYPGAYNQPANSELLNRKRNHSNRHTINELFIITDQPDCCEVHVVAPGYAREDFLVFAVNNRLSIQATKKSDPRNKGKHFELEIQLPREVDTDFVSATYKNGMLNFYFLKTFAPSRGAFTQIIVY